MAAMGWTGDGIGGWCSTTMVPSGAGLASSAVRKASDWSSRGPVLLAGDGGVEGDDAQPAAPADLSGRPGAGLGAVVSASVAGAVEQASAEGGAVVVVAMQVDDVGTRPGRRPGHNGGEVVVTGGLAVVRQVAGQQEHVRPNASRLQRVQPAQ
jgi:hypothetical protein